MCKRKVKRNEIDILIIWISLIQNTWIYCSTWDSIAALGLRPRCCNTVPRAAINPRILNAWNSNYKYLYITYFFSLYIILYSQLSLFFLFLSFSICSLPLPEHIELVVLDPDLHTPIMQELLLMLYNNWANHKTVLIICESIWSIWYLFWITHPSR